MKTLTKLQEHFETCYEPRDYLIDRELGYELLENTQDYEMYQVIDGRIMINLTFYINMGKIEIEKLIWDNEDWRETRDQTVDLSVLDFIQKKIEDLNMKVKD